MKQVKVANTLLYKFDLFAALKGVEACVTTRIGGVSDGTFAELNLALHVGDDNSKVLRNRVIVADALGLFPNDLTFGQQTHETNIKVVTENDRGRGATTLSDGFDRTDALITDVPGIPIAVLSADCAGIFLYDKLHNAVGIVHSGRKGTEGEIVIKVVQKMRDTYGTCPENLLVGIGPCIYPCCYEIDLPNTISNQLLEAGVSLKNIENSGFCTSCHEDIFYSYRARGSNLETGRFMNLIMLK